MFGRKVWIKEGLIAALMVICSCSPRGEAAAQNGSGVDSAGMELPLPQMPADLTEPQERAAYILAHFWDGMDFTDTVRTKNAMFMEQNFANFISLFPVATDEARRRGIDELLGRARADWNAFKTVTDIAEKYLFDPSSPVKNEEYYIAFAEEVLRTEGLPENCRLRPEAQLKTALKNRLGTKATDFAYTTREGKTGRLLKTKAERLLVVFYDPACPHCKDILDELRNSDVVNQMREEGKLKVLAVYTEGNRELWDETKAEMPEAWEVSIDESSIVDSSLYDLPAMPVIYLLNKEKTVMLKDPTPAQLFDKLAEEEGL